MTSSPHLHSFKSQKYGVIGGGGFLGKWIVDELLNRGEKHVRVLDIRPSPTPDDRVEFVQVDVTKIDTLRKGLAGLTTVIHTASPPHGKGYQMYYNVNVEGTKNVVEACVELGIKQLVFTSSASVVFDGRHIKGGDESLPYCKTHLDGYTETKEKAERIVLEANGRKGLLTVALRPSGIFGPGDAQGWPGFIEAAQNGKSKFQLGDGSNLMDWTYVENVAYAHVLAADKLVPGNDKVAGQAFFITNDEPAPFWDMAKYIWKNLDYPTPTVVVPYWLAYYLALLLDWIVWLLSPLVSIHLTFTFFRVVYAGAHRYFTIEKAKRDLGYKPKVALKEGMARTLKAFEHKRNPKATGSSSSSGQDKKKAK